MRCVMVVVLHGLSPRNDPSNVFNVSGLMREDTSPQPTRPLSVVILMMVRDQDFSEP
jgi:hypothetical protein